MTELRENSTIDLKGHKSNRNFSLLQVTTFVWCFSRLSIETESQIEWFSSIRRNFCILAKQCHHTVSLFLVSVLFHSLPGSYPLPVAVYHSDTCPTCFAETIQLNRPWPCMAVPGGNRILESLCAVTQTFPFPFQLENLNVKALV